MRVNGAQKPFEVVQISKNQLKGNWGTAISVYFIYWIVSNITDVLLYLCGWDYQIRFSMLGQYYSIATNTAIIFWVNTLITGPFLLGLANYFIKLARQEPSSEAFFHGMKRVGPSIILLVLKNLFAFLWSLLFIIPGIWASLRYSQSFYILNDHPDISAMEALNRSKKMMDGHIGEYISLWISFIGWYLLISITAGILGYFIPLLGALIWPIGILIIAPYLNLSLANFYENLRIADSTQLDSPNINESIII